LLQAERPRDCGLEHSLLELVKIRASQINGCGYCLDMHTKDARAAGEREQRATRPPNFDRALIGYAVATVSAVAAVSRALALGPVPPRHYRQNRTSAP
jgi:AhpD family alkylhydroperoxidase